MAIAAEWAASVFREEAIAASSGSKIDADWSRKVEKLSSLCETGGSATHIAFLGTTILAKTVDKKVDLYAIKPRHAGGNGNAYSARTLCHNVLVPLAAELGVNIGVNGREPLNNQPYFRMNYLGDDTPVHSKARPAFDYMLSLVGELQRKSSLNARRALRAFIAVRRRYQTVYVTTEGRLAVSWATLAHAISRLVAEESEGGRRAQAVVAGLFDVFAGYEWVESGRINDPSRHYPGDVAIRNLDGGWGKAIEVRDKRVYESDVFIFGRLCLSKGVREAGVVLAATNQPRLNDSTIRKWAADAGLGLSLFYGWDEFVDQILFWSALPKPDGLVLAVERIEARLIGVQASGSSVRTWQTLTKLPDKSN